MGSRHYLHEELHRLFQAEPERVFRFLDEGAVDGIWYWDVESGQDEWYSPAFTRLLGFEPEEVPRVATWWQERIFPDDRELAVRNFNQHAADPEHPYDQVVRYRHRDGSTIWVRCRGLAVRNGRGEPIRMLGTHTDVTELMEARAALSEQNLDLERFADRVTHDLRAPLRHVKQYARLLGESLELDGEPKEWMEGVKRSAQRAESLIEQLLAYARLGVGSEEPCEPVALAPLVDEVLRDLRESTEQAAVTLEVGALPTVRGVRAELRLVLFNLLSNALKFRSEDRPAKISIAGGDAADSVWFHVRDNGVGVPAECHDMIFAPLARNAARRHANETGMGLALVRRAIEKAGGTVRLDSAPGRGSTFRVELPGGDNGG